MGGDTSRNRPRGLTVLLGCLALLCGCGDDGGREEDSGPTGDEDAAVDASRAVDSGTDAALADAGSRDAAMDSGLDDASLDAGDADGGTEDGGGDAGADDAGPSLADASASFLVACYDECDKLVTCAPGVSTLAECQGLCDDEQTRREGAAASGTPEDEVIACFMAKRAESECLVSQTCDDFVEHFTRPDVDFPCRAEEVAMEAACASS